jgi:hypothetical protein
MSGQERDGEKKSPFLLGAVHRLNKTVGCLFNDDNNNNSNNNRVIGPLCL